MFHIVLVSPEIPNNTGCIGRTALGTGCHLHLIEPLGFRLDEKSLKRAGLDYWKDVSYTVHSSFEEFTSSISPDSRLICFSTHAENGLFDVSFQESDYLVFGQESQGLPASVLDHELALGCRIPISEKIRSLNLATAVGVAVFEGIRQLSR